MVAMSPVHRIWVIHKQDPAVDVRMCKQSPPDLGGVGSQNLSLIEDGRHDDQNRIVGSLALHLCTCSNCILVPGCIMDCRACYGQLGAGSVIVRGSRPGQADKAVVGNFTVGPPGLSEPWR